MKKSLILLSFFILLSISLLYVLHEVKYKYYETTKRIRLIESKLKSYGDHIVNDLETYQKTRKPNKVLSEVKDNIIFDWKELEVPWIKQKFTRTKALVVWNNNLVVGLQGNIEKGPSTYIYDKKKWTKLIADNNYDLWGDLDEVFNFAVHDGKLFAGINYTLWMLNKENKWSLIKNFEDKNIPRPSVYSMKSHNGYLYVGLTQKNSSLYRMKDDVWENVSLGLDEHPNNGIYEMLSHTDGNLYASNISVLDSTVVYKFDEKNLKWSAIGGKGINSSWINSSFTKGLSLSSHKKLIFLTMNRHPKTYGNFSNIWAYDGNQWYAIGNKKPPKLWNEVDNFNSSLSFKDIFFIGSGGNPAGNATVWALNKNKWKLIGGKGVYNSWGANFTNTLTNDFRNTAYEYPYRFVEFDNSMIVGFGDASNAATLWQLRVMNK